MQTFICSPTHTMTVWHYQSLTYQLKEDTPMTESLPIVTVQFDDKTVKGPLSRDKALHIAKALMDGILSSEPSPQTPNAAPPPSVNGGISPKQLPLSGRTPNGSVIISANTTMSPLWRASRSSRPPKPSKIAWTARHKRNNSSMPS